MSAQNYRFKCRNCQHEFLRRFTVEEFDKTQYKGGFSCFDCGFGKMIVNKSFTNIKDNFQPGHQKNINKWWYFIGGLFCGMAVIFIYWFIFA